MVKHTGQYPTAYPDIHPFDASFSSNNEHRLQIGTVHAMQTYFVLLLHSEQLRTLAMDAILIQNDRLSGKENSRMIYFSNSHNSYI